MTLEDFAQVCVSEDGKLITNWCRFVENRKLQHFGYRDEDHLWLLKKEEGWFNMFDQ